MNWIEYRGTAKPYQLRAEVCKDPHPLRKLWNTVRRKSYIKNEATSLKNIFPTVLFGAEASLNSLYGGGIIRLREGSIILGQMILTSPRSIIEIAEHTFLGSNVQLNAQERISIGAHVLIASEVNILDNNSHSTNYLIREGDIELFRKRMAGVPDPQKDFSQVSCEPIVIEDHVWIGMRSIILKGVRICARSIVAAGAVIVHNVPPDVIVAGNPARIVKRFA
jgi:acetyltransferase-like isoleucine patch superfamily enzyme